MVASARGADRDGNDAGALNPLVHCHRNSGQGHTCDEPLCPALNHNLSASAQCGARSARASGPRRPAAASPMQAAAPCSVRTCTSHAVCLGARNPRTLGAETRNAANPSGAAQLCAPETNVHSAPPQARHPSSPAARAGAEVSGRAHHGAKNFTKALLVSSKTASWKVSTVSTPGVAWALLSSSLKLAILGGASPSERVALPPVAVAPAAGASVACAPARQAHTTSRDATVRPRSLRLRRLLPLLGFPLSLPLPLLQEVQSARSCVWSARIVVRALSCERHACGLFIAHAAETEAMDRPHVSSTPRAVVHI